MSAACAGQRPRTTETTRSTAQQPDTPHPPLRRSYASSSSDVDLTGDLPDGMGLFGLLRAQDDFEAILGCRVDLVPQ